MLKFHISDSCNSYDNVLFRQIDFVGFFFVVITEFQVSLPLFKFNPIDTI